MLAGEFYNVNPYLEIQLNVTRNIEMGFGAAGAVGFRVVGEDSRVSSYEAQRLLSNVHILGALCPF